MEVVRITFEGRCSHNSPRYTRDYHALLPSENFSRFHQQVVSITLRDFSLKSDAKIRKRIDMARKTFRSNVTDDCFFSQIVLMSRSFGTLIDSLFYHRTALRLYGIIEIQPLRGC